MSDAQGRRADDVEQAALFVTCVGEVVDPDVPVAAVRVLRRAGCEVTVPEGQTCCGQPAWNSGFTADAARVARTSLDALAQALDDGADAVVVPAGSCATMMRLYWPQLFELAGDADGAARARQVGERLWELTELLDALPDDRRPSGSVPACRVAYHRSCHMLRELHVEEQPEALLSGVEGCDVEPWAAADQCCGFGGTFSVKLPEASVAMADEKLDVLPEGVEVIVGADASCLLQLRARAEARGLPVRTTHIAQLLEQAAEEGSGA
ncbi:MAG TPA: (Fe-S)-binding protein [Acidimicrobiales bacterium]|nr:(Fe-S)-binding protein [Acidimicrobiales bacterium]